MNLTKVLTIPYSASRIPSVNSTLNRARTNVCLCGVFNSGVPLLSCTDGEGLAGPRGIEPRTYGLRASA